MVVSHCVIICTLKKKFDFLITNFELMTLYDIHVCTSIYTNEYYQNFNHKISYSILTKKSSGWIPNKSLKYRKAIGAYVLKVNSE